MSQASIPSLTPLQQKILHANAANPGQPAKYISDVLDCSTSYVRDVLQQYPEIQDNIEQLDSLSYLPSFSQPYSVIVPEEFAKENGFSEGDTIKLEFEIDGDHRESYGKVKYLPEGFFSEDSDELQARVHGGYFAADLLNQKENTGFDSLPVLKNGRANFDTDNAFTTFIHSVFQDLHEQISNDIYYLIGIGILEVIHEQREPSNLISTPYFDIEPELFVKYLSEDLPELSDFRLYYENPSTPSEVYFTYYGEYLNEEQLQEAQETLLDQEIFKTNWNYTIPGYNALVGPTTTEETEEVVRVTEDSLEIVPGIRRSYAFYTEDGHIFSNFDGGIVEQTIQDANPKFQSLAPHSRYSTSSDGLPIRRNGDNLYFLFDQVTLVLTADDDRLVWSSPQGIDRIETIIEAVLSMIESQLEVEDYEQIETQEPQSKPVTQDSWAIDTNSLYHDHNADQPTSILHTILPNLFFYESTIHIPWAVLFEMNKHPESGSGTKAANEQGFENLAMLQTLEQLGFLSTEIQTPPKRVEGNLRNGDIADIYVLAHADECEANLITGDGSLRGIAQFADTEAVNISRLDSLTTPIGQDSSIETEVLSKIGVELHERERIIDEISDGLNQEATIPQPETSNELPEDPESFIETWCSDAEIVPYYRSNTGTLCYAQCEEITVIPVQSVLEYLPERIPEDNGNYLPEDCLQEISDGITEIGSDALPYLELIVASEYILENASEDRKPSEFNKGILELARLETVEYHSEPALEKKSALTERIQFGEQSNSKSDGNLLDLDDYLAFCLAHEIEEAYLLLPDSQNGLWKFAQLLGIDYTTVDAVVETENEEN